MAAIDKEPDDSISLAIVLLPWFIIGGTVFVFMCPFWLNFLCFLSKDLYQSKRFYSDKFFEFVKEVGVVQIFTFVWNFYICLKYNSVWSLPQRCRKNSRKFFRQQVPSAKL